MRNILIIFMLFGLSTYSQSEKYSGNYENKTKSEDGIVIDYELALNLDGTFVFHFYQDQICYTDDNKAKGKWTTENGIIIFQVNKEIDIDETYKLDFDKTKAKVKNGILEFYDCGVLWINKVKLKKK